MFAWETLAPHIFLDRCTGLIEYMLMCMAYHMGELCHDRLKGKAELGSGRYRERLGFLQAPSGTNCKQLQGVTGQIYGRKKYKSRIAEYNYALLTQNYLKWNLQSSAVGMDI